MKMATEEPQQFCLRWHNYQSSLLATLPQLLDGDDLTDVTLCAGSRSLKAHRVVLSACSEYFKELFKELGASHHPVIVLPGVDFTDLCALVTFMYSGEVNIYEAQLASLLAMADTLHIRGLADFSNTSNLSPKPTIRTKRARMTDNQDINSRVRNKPTFAETEVYTDWTMPSLTNVDLNTENIVQDLSKRISDNDPPNITTDLSATTTTELPMIKHESTSYMETRITTEEFATATDLTQGTSDNLKVKAVSKMYTTCFICGKQLSNHYNLRVHMETHQNVQYACSACNHVSRSRDALRKHVSYRHPPAIGDGTSPKKPAALT